MISPWPGHYQFIQRLNSMKIRKLAVILSLLIVNLVHGQKSSDSLQLKIVNGKSFFMHKVSKGQTLTMILKQYNVDITLLEDANKAMNLKKLKRNDMLLIPVVGIKKNQTDSSSSSKKIDDAHANADEIKIDLPKNHIVQSGETLHKISQKYKVSVADLVKWNSIKNNTIEVGRELIVNHSAVMKPFQAWNKWNIAGQNQSRIISPIQNQDEVVVQSGYLIVSEEAGIVLHPTLPVGTFVLVKNLESDQELLLKVTGTMFSKAESNFIITLGKDWAEKLNINIGLSRVTVKHSN